MPPAGVPSPGEGIRFIVSPVDLGVVNRMPDRTPVLMALLLVALAFIPAVSAVTVYPGSEVLLAGTSTGSDTVYLFVTGPNLPPAGGRLDNPHTAVRSGNPGSFTRVSVGADDRWTYRWRTGEAGLDPGTYTVYAVDAPVDRRNLSGHRYTTIPVTLGSPPPAPATGTVVPATPAPAESEATAMPTATPGTIPTTAAPVSALAACGAVLLAVAVLVRR
jgi:hypothetical protein